MSIAILSEFQPVIKYALPVRSTGWESTYGSQRLLFPVEYRRDLPRCSMLSPIPCVNLRAVLAMARFL